MTGVLLVSAAFGADSDGKVLVREGAAITGMAGELSMVKAEDGPYIRLDGDDAWLFKLGGLSSMYALFASMVAVRVSI